MTQLICSLPNPDGHVVVARLADGARVVVTFADDDTTQHDLTDFVAELVLLGMQVQVERARGEAAAPHVDDQIEAGTVSVVGSTWPAPTFLYVHPATRTVTEATWEATTHILELGIAAQLTAGVAAETAEQELPDSPAELDVEDPDGMAEHGTAEDETPAADGPAETGDGTDGTRQR